MRGKELPPFGKYLKADLIWILERAYTFGGGASIRLAVDDLENKKYLERMNKCDAISKEAEECRSRCSELVKPFAGKPLSEIPRDILEQAANEIERAQKLDKEWDYLIKQC